MAKYFKRIIKVSTGGVTFTNAVLHIRFEIPFDDDHVPNGSIIQIYNLAHDSREKIKVDEPLTVIAGYEGDEGVILSLIHI